MAPKISSRVDLKKYHKATKNLKHFVPSPHQPIKRTGTKFIFAPPDGERVVSMQPYAGIIMLATDKGIYLLGTKHKVDAFAKNFKARALHDLHRL